MLSIRIATEADFDGIWPIFREVVAAGDTYAYPRETNREQALELWLRKPRRTFVLEERGSGNDAVRILGTYYIKTNQDGRGSHVCNCGYMVAAAARGRGFASRMREHSQEIAREPGYQAMQFNFVAASNEGALRLRTKLGFDTVGRLPGAFLHPTQGLIDALVMYKWLAVPAAANASGAKQS